MALSLQNIRDFFGGLVGVEDATLTIRNTMAALRISQDGIALAHDAYDALHVYALGSALASAGLISATASDVVEEKVADVSVKYGKVSNSSESLAEGRSLTYEELYILTLNHIGGMAGRIGGGPIV